MTTMLLAATLLMQAKVTISRAEKGDYPKAISYCKEAVAQIEKSPQDAIDLLDKVFNELKLKKFEVVMRIEERPAEYTSWYEFFPYQYRGRAKAALAKAGGDRAEALWTAAVEDLQKSAELGLESSKAPLEEARTELERIKAAKANPGEDPYALFKRKFDLLIGENKFKTARAIIATDGKLLNEAQRKEFSDKAEKACQEYLDTETGDFRSTVKAFATADKSRELLEIPADEFALKFRLPSPEELIGISPKLEWARLQRAAIDGGRQRKKFPLPGLLEAAAAAAKIAPSSESTWLRASEQLAGAAAARQLEAQVEQAAKASSADLKAIRAEAEAVVRDYKAFETRLDADVRQLNPYVRARVAELEKLMEAFPSDLAELARIDVESCLASDDPSKELAAVLAALEPLRGRKSVTRESRAKLLTWIVCASALRDLLDGRTEAEAAATLKTVGAELKAEGGAVDARRFGPRVEKILADVQK